MKSSHVATAVFLVICCFTSVIESKANCEQNQKHRDGEEIYLGETKNSNKCKQNVKKNYKTTYNGAYYNDQTEECYAVLGYTKTKSNSDKDWEFCAIDADGSKDCSKANKHRNGEEVSLGEEKNMNQCKGKVEKKYPTKLTAAYYKKETKECYAINEYTKTKSQNDKDWKFCPIKPSSQSGGGNGGGDNDGDFDYDDFEDYDYEDYDYEDYDYDFDIETVTTVGTTATTATTTTITTTPPTTTLPTTTTTITPPFDPSTTTSTTTVPETTAPPTTTTTTTTPPTTTTTPKPCEPQFADTEGQLEVVSCESMEVKDETRGCNNLFDGSLSRVVKDNVCFVTKSNYKGWLELKLAKTSMVNKLVLLSKGNGDGLAGTIVSVCMDNKKNCVRFGKIYNVKPEKCTILKGDPIAGNMVRFYIADSALAICELRVYGI